MRMLSLEYASPEQISGEVGNHFNRYLLNGYSGLHQGREEYNLAEADLRRALEIGQAIFPETHPFIGVVYYNLGELYR